jgi:DNA-binding MarR family transcriptional regulator
MLAIDQVQRLTVLFQKRRAQLARSVGLTEAQWRVMEGVATEHFMPSLFADERAETRGAVSKMLRQLTDKRLVKASISGEDGRQRKYVLTARGRQALEKLRVLRENAIREIWSGPTVKQLGVLNQCCDHLIGNMRSYAAREQTSP